MRAKFYTCASPQLWHWQMQVSQLGSETLRGVSTYHRASLCQVSGRNTHNSSLSNYRLRILHVRSKIHTCASAQLWHWQKQVSQLGLKLCQVYQHTTEHPSAKFQAETRTIQACVIIDLVVCMCGLKFTLAHHHNFGTGKSKSHSLV